MKKDKIVRDSSSYYVGTSAGRLRAGEVGGLAKIAVDIEDNRPKPPQVFLNAWQNAVYLAGESFFEIRSETFETATYIDQLQTNIEIITASSGTLSPRERKFLLSLYQFYSDSTVRDLCAEYSYPFPSLADIATFDSKY